MSIKIYKYFASIPPITFQKKVTYINIVLGFYTTILGVLDNNHSIRLIGVAIHTNLNEI